MLRDPYWFTGNFAIIRYPNLMPSLGDYSINSIIAGVFFGLIGMLFFKEGKKRTHAELYFIGVALILYSYFVTHDILVWVVGIALTAVGFMMLAR